MIRVESPETLPAWLSGEGPDSDVVVSTRVRLARCLAGHQFPATASLKHRTAAFDEIVSVMTKLPRYERCELFNFMQCERLHQEFLVENRVASPDLLHAEGDRGVLVDDVSRLSIIINEEDHLRLQCLDCGYRPGDTWRVLSEVDNEIGGHLVFAFDKRRGFLTSCPTNSGTGLRVSFLMHLPGLILTKTVDSVLQGASQMGIAVRGFFGEHSCVVGSFFQLSNQATMGRSEEEFLRSTGEAVGEVIRCERRARQTILRDAKAELGDKVYRAYGILIYARSLSMDELLNLTSAVRLGVESGIFGRVSVRVLNRMILLGMPAHLQFYCGRELNEEECASRRAELAREMLPPS